MLSLVCYDKKPMLALEFCLETQIVDVTVLPPDDVCEDTSELFLNIRLDIIFGKRCPPHRSKSARSRVVCLQCKFSLKTIGLITTIHAVSHLEANTVEKSDTNSNMKQTHPPRAEVKWFGASPCLLGCKQIFQTHTLETRLMCCWQLIK